MSLVRDAEQKRRQEAQSSLALDIARGDEEPAIHVRAVVERGYSESFRESLDMNLQKKTSEIERISSRHYSDFLRSIESMFEIRGSAEEIGSVVKEINSDFTEAGNKLVDILTKLKINQQEREKTRKVLESVLRCKDLSKVMNSCRENLQNDDTYGALRNLLHLHAMYIAPGVPSLPKPMTDILHKWYPANVESLVRSSVGEAEQLFVRLRERVESIGQVVLKRQASVALGANKYSVLALTTPGDGAGGRDADGQSRGAASTSSPGLGGGNKEGGEALSTEEYKRLFSKLPSLYRAPAFSLQCVKRCIPGLKLHKWAKGTDVEGWLSSRFTMVLKKKEKGALRRRRRSSGRLTRSFIPSRSPAHGVHTGPGLDGSARGTSERNSEAAAAQALGRVRSTSASKKDATGVDGRRERPASPHDDGSGVFRNHGSAVDTCINADPETGATVTEAHGEVSFGDVSHIDYQHPISEEDEKFFDEITEELGPIYKAIHVCAVLGRLPYLNELFSRHREVALDSLIDRNTQRMKELSLSDAGGLDTYISELAGYFMLEAMIGYCVRVGNASLDGPLDVSPTGEHGHGGNFTSSLTDAKRSSQGSGTAEKRPGMAMGRPLHAFLDAQVLESLPYFQTEEISSLWNKACLSLDMLVAKQSNSLRTPEQLVSVKDELCLLIDSCRDVVLDLPCHGLVETTRLLWAQFEELQTHAVREDALSLIVSPYSFVALQVESSEDYRERVEAFELHTAAIKHVETDRRVREKIARDGNGGASSGGSEESATVSGRLNVVLQGALSVNRTSAREIVNGTYGLADHDVESTFCASIGGAVSNESGLPSHRGHGLDSTVYSEVGESESNRISSGMTSTVTPRKRASNLRMNLDALEEDVLGSYDGQSCKETEKDEEQDRGALHGLGKVGSESSIVTGSSGGSGADSSRVVSPSSDLGMVGGDGGTGPDGTRERVGSWSSDTSGMTTDTTIAATGSSASGGRGTPGGTPRYPTSMPFSALVPGMQRCLYKVILRIVGFTAKNPPLSDVCEAACGMLVRAFECIALTMSDELQRSSTEDTPMNKACQVAVDAATLAIASGNVWRMLAHSLHTLSWYRPSNSKMVAMFADAERQSRLLFMKVSLLGQSLLLDVLTRKTKELLESLLFMEYLPQSLPRGPHEGVVDIISFLQAKMDTLSTLPRSTRDIAHFTACTTLSEGLLGHLLSPQVKNINILALAAIDLDCRKLSQYALSIEIPSLNQCFAETHETVQAALHSDMAKLTANKDLRKRLFPRASTSKLIGLLEKMVPLDPSIAIASLPRLEQADIRRSVEDLKRQVGEAAP